MSLSNIDPLSYSSSNELIGCEQKYVYRKVLRVDRDADAPLDTLALDIGKVLHACLEDCCHDLHGFEMKRLRFFMEKAGLSAEHYPLLKAMLKKYRDLNDLSGLVCHATEVEIRLDDFIGFVDLILTEQGKQGRWWISDVKTASSVSSFLISRLGRDKQLNLYTAMIDPEKLGLCWETFAGCKYRVVTKSRIKRRKDEDDSSLTLRMYESIEAREFTVPKELLDPEGALANFKRQRERQVELWKNPDLAMRNHNYCESYFRPCEYWSQCHSCQFTEDSTITEIVA